MVGNKGGRSVVGNKGGRGVVGNKGNTTPRQSKVNAAEKRKSFEGNTETGLSKRSAGKRSGLKRSAKHALVVKNRWLQKKMHGETDWETRSSRTRHRGWVTCRAPEATHNTTEHCNDLRECFCTLSGSAQ